MIGKLCSVFTFLGILSLFCNNVHVQSFSVQFQSPRIRRISPSSIMGIHSYTTRYKRTQHSMVIEKEDVQTNDIDELQKIVQEAAALSYQADNRVQDLEKRTEILQQQIEDKEAKLKEQSTAWFQEKTWLVARVAELSNLLNAKNENTVTNQTIRINGNSNGDADNDNDSNFAASGNINQLENEIQTMKQALHETQQSLKESIQAAEEMRSRLMEGEDLLEFEQMRFEKEKREMEERIQLERDKMNQVARDFQVEQQKFATDRDGLIKRIDDALSKLAETETKMSQEKLQYNREASALKNTIRGLKENLVEAQTRLSEETRRFSEERADLKQQIKQQKMELESTEKKLLNMEQEFRSTTKELESIVSRERDRVQKLTKNLEDETKQFLQEKSELQSQLIVERRKLAEIEAAFETEKKRFSMEEMALQNQVREGERIRKLKARQMNERYTAIRSEMLDRLEAVKRDARREEQRLTKKYQGKLHEVYENTMKLESDLIDAKNRYVMIAEQLSNATIERERVLLEKDRSDRQFLQTISARNMEIISLKQDIESLNAQVQQQDEVIERYESSYREMLKLSMQLTGRRLKDAPSKLVGFVRKLKKGTTKANFNQ